MSTTGARPRGALERQVLASLAVADHPLTVAEVLAELGGDLAYTTVMTTLTRLHSKGALVREQIGRAYTYTVAGDAQAMGSSVTAQRMRRLLEAGDDRAGVLTRFVAGLRPEDEQLLAALLAATEHPEPR
jgi:predicted transcriptional regulator